MVGQTPMRPKYRCPDGHEFWSTGKLELAPETCRVRMSSNRVKMHVATKRTASTAVAIS